MKLLITCAILISTTLAEPPVNNRYLPPHRGAAPASLYGAPSTTGFNRHGTLRSRPTFSRRPSTQYLAPQTPSSQYGVPISAPVSLPSPQYGVPQAGFGRQAAPSALYGAPGVGPVNALGTQQTRQYLPPGVGGYDDGSNGEPANYNFEYMVKDDQSGNDFGHRESRLGDRAEGLYYVVLPDGRKQTVEYEADRDGYKPRVSYEDTGLGIYRNTQAGGYPHGY